jgi:hypothetical protein
MELSMLGAVIIWSADAQDKDVRLSELKLKSRDLQIQALLKKPEQLR